MTTRRAVKLRLLTFNTHVGLAIFGLRWLVKQTRPHVVALQEVQTRRAKLKVRLVLRPHRWRKLGPPLDSPAGTILYVRRARFRVVNVTHRLITPGPAAGALPARYLDGAALVDRRTGRVVDLTVIHAWALGRGLPSADDHARRKHTDQLAEVADHVRPAAADPQALVGALGDTNEQLDAPWQTTRDDSARAILAGAGLRPSFRLIAGSDDVDLDEIFLVPRPWFRVVRRTVIDTPDPRADHRAVYVALDVDPLTA